jgi:cyclic-di-GMP phosphodiesterase TipF (flagellum assembly factor)
MGRMSAAFIAVCMVLIAASVGAVTYLAFAFTGLEAAVVAIATLTALVMVNSVTSRTRDRFDTGSQIADLSRGTADIARHVSELDRRIVALEGEVSAAVHFSRSTAEPLASEIDELGQLVKELADAVAAHEQMLESAISNATPARPSAAPFPEPVAQRPEYASPAAPFEASAPPPARRAASGPFQGMEEGAIVAQLARAIEANKIDLHLQPIVTLPQRKVRYYEALVRLRADDGALLTPDDFLGYAEDHSLMPAIDNLMVFRCVQVVRRLSTKNREVGLFCNISGSTLTNANMFHEITEFLEANRAIAPYLVFEFSQFAVRALGPIEQECIAALADLGFRFSMDHVTDLRIEPRELAERGFRFVKVPATLLLNRASAPRSDIHPADFSDLLGRYGIDLIAEKIESEGTVVDLLDYDVRFGQGYLFSPPRPVRAEVLQGIAERPAERAAPKMPEARQPDVRAAEPPAAAAPRASESHRAPEVTVGEPRPPGERRAGAMAQIARGIVRRAQG